MRQTFIRGLWLFLVAMLLMACGGEVTGQGASRPTETPRTSSSTEPESPSPETAEPTATQTPFTYGDDPTLDQLWDLCATGDPDACEELYSSGPVGSEYEAFGDTCGDTASGGGCIATGQPESWAAIAEQTCAAVYGSRGSAPTAESGDIDDEMALYYNWLADSIDGAVYELSSVEGAGPEGQAFTSGMSDYSRLAAEAAQIYVQQVVFSERLNQLTADMEQTSSRLSYDAQVLGVPSCAALLG